MNLRKELISEGYEVVSCDLAASNDIVNMDILNPDEIRRTIEEYRPDALVHMAGQANVGLSWQKPQLTVQLNVIGTINILESIRLSKSDIKTVLIGSSDEYGVLKDKGKNVTENILVNPVTPYAISKRTQELFAELYVTNYKLDICVARQFNMCGEGQAKGFIVSDFASGIAEVEAGKKQYLCVGNLDSSRDFIHVKDACRAMRFIIEAGHTGEVYNVCSGKSYKAKEILEYMIGKSEVPIKIKTDPAKMRPSDTPVICGNHDKLTNHTGWRPKYKIEQALDDALDYWRKQIQ